MNGIAIIGMACRFPGAPDLDSFWRNLCEGKESITFFSRAELAAAGVPAELLDAPGFVPASPALDGADQFDAAFFNYTAREAAFMDPQQRLFLEVAWEALEDAGYRPDGVEAPVGVFAGSGGVVTSYLATYHERAPELLGPTGSLQHIGNDKDFLATRVSFKLDLRGPSINVQTACSTSLVALHLACRSLLDGECDLALAGASTVRFPHHNGYVYQSEDILSPDGHCRPFDAKAQGTVFGSGVGAVLLKPLAAAVADGDHVYAVIKGSAINNDGARKVSYTASSVPGQARAMVEAMTLAGVPPDSIGYVECHATATTVGDPLEIQALTRAFRTGTDGVGFCGIGSVKSNIGHLEQAAGMASLIKTALAIEHGQLPPTINFESANPRLALAASPFYVQDRLRAWEAPSGQPRRAALNGLGLGGTNAFVVLEEAPAATRAANAAVGDAGVAERPLHVFALSARSDAALAESAARFERRLADDGEDAEAALGDVCFTTSTSRSAFTHRLAIAARSADELRRGLAGFGAGTLPAHLSKGQGKARPLAFLFTGQGAQYAGMAATLYRTQPIFRAALDECDTLSRPYLDRPLSSVLFADGDDAGLIHETGYTQVALFAVEYALATLWGSWGVVPEVVMGHSVGEFAAACFAGVMDLGDAVKLIAHRGRLMQGLPRTGGMMAVFAAEAGVRELLAPFGDRLAIAGSNAPLGVVVAGDKAALDALLPLLHQREIACKELVVSHAFHSALMEPILDDLEAVARDIRFRAPRLKVVSNLTGGFMTGAPDARYWREHARYAVRFMEGMKTLHAAGYGLFVEIGPGSGLLGLGRQCLPDEGLRWLPSLSRQKDDWDLLGQTLRELYVQGHAVDWRGFDRPYARRRLSLPTYPFQRKRHWVSESRRAAARPRDQHPLLGARLRSTLKEAQFEARFSLDELAYLDDHRIFGLPVLPTTAALELIGAGGRQHFGAAVAVESFLYREALVLPEEGGRVVHLVITPTADDKASFKVFSAAEEGTPAWIQHMEGQLARLPRGGAEAAHAISLAELRGRCARAIPIDRYYPAIREMGLEYGPAFRGIQELWQGEGEALSRVRLPEHVAAEPYTLQPAFLDACLHIYPALAAVYGDFTVPPEELRRTFLPISMERFTVEGVEGVEAVEGAAVTPSAPRPREAWVHARARAGSGAEVLTVDIGLYDDDGRLLATMTGLQLRRLTPEAMQPSAAADPLREAIYQLQWEERPALPPLARAADAPMGRWLIFADRGGVGAALGAQLQALGETPHLVYRDRLALGGQPIEGLDPGQPGLFHRLLRDYFGVPGIAFRHIVYLWSLDAPAHGELNAADLQASERALMGSALGVVQAVSVVNSVTGAAPRLWLVTRSAQAVAAGEAGDVMQLPLWALGSAMALRHADLWGGMLDLELHHGTTPTADATALVGEMWQSDGEDQVALRGGKRLAPRLVRAPAPRSASSSSAAAANEAPLFRADATYLVAGGLGDIGLRVAEWLVAERGVRHLVLADRRPLDDKSRAAVRTLSARGATVNVFQVDLTQEAEVAKLFADLRTQPPLKGVLHCAGAGEDDLFDMMQWKTFVRATAPKAIGAWLLHQHTRALELDHFVLFSSVLNWVGSETRTNQAAGNLFLEALARFRRARGLPAMVINWGPWQLEDGAGAAADAAAAEAARGIQRIEPARAFAAFEHLLRHQIDHAAVAAVDWPLLTQKFKGGAPALYSELGKGMRKRRAQRAGDDPRLHLSRIRAAPANERRRVVLEVVQRQVTDVLGAEEPVDVQSPLTDFGLDSLISVNLVNRLEPALGITVPLAKLLQGASTERLVDELLPLLTQTLGG